MSNTKFSNFKSEDGSTGPDLVGITSFTSPYYFVPPSGNTAQRPSGEGLAPGMLRFNTDIGRLETWRGDHWATILGESPNLDGGARGVIAGGRVDYSGPAAIVNTIDLITISTLGNAIDFGDLSASQRRFGSCASSTRGVFGGGFFPADTAVMTYITFSSTGNSTSFGNLTESKRTVNGLANSTRGVWLGGTNNTPTTDTNKNTIEYITIASTGNGVDFGDLTQSRDGPSTIASSTRGIAAGGSAGGYVNTIDFITISTTGNAVDYGDLVNVNGHFGGCGSNSTRGVFAGGYSPTLINNIEYITIATTGNSQDFGDLTTTRAPGQGGCFSSTRGVFGGGYKAPDSTNVIDYITIATTGDAIDFGDMQAKRHAFAACSNAHGGL